MVIPSWVDALSTVAIVTAVARKEAAIVLHNSADLESN